MLSRMLTIQMRKYSDPVPVNSKGTRVVTGRALLSGGWGDGGGAEGPAPAAGFGRGGGAGAAARGIGGPAGGVAVPG